MNTLLLFGSSRMGAFCPYCGHPLEHRPGEAPEIVLPFFGAAGAGKTRLLFSIVTQLQVWTRERAARRRVRATAVTTRELDARRARSCAPAAPPPRPRSSSPARYVIRVRLRARDPDPAHVRRGGRAFLRTRTAPRNWGTSAKARTFILVIDPLSVEAFWARLPPGRRAELGPMPARPPPRPTWPTSRRTRRSRRWACTLRKARLAVVFSRADLIGAPER